MIECEIFADDQRDVESDLTRVHGAVFHLLRSYAVLVMSLYGSLILPFFVVFLPIMFIARINVLRFLRHIRGPALTAFSTASSEAALPRLLEEMEGFGVPRRVASFVILTGYSFNLDGSTLSVLFGIPGEAGVAMILAVAEIMDMARSTINLTGNGLASVVITLGRCSRPLREGASRQLITSRALLPHPSIASISAPGIDFSAIHCFTSRRVSDHVTTRFSAQPIPSWIPRVRSEA